MYRCWLVFLFICFVGSLGWGAPCSVKVETNPQFPEWTAYAKQRLLSQRPESHGRDVVQKRAVSKAKHFLKSMFADFYSSDRNRELRLRELSSEKFTQWQQRQKWMDPTKCLGGCPSYNPGFQFKAESICRVSVASEKGESYFDLPLSCTEFFSYYGNTNYHPLKAKILVELNSCS